MIGLPTLAGVLCLHTLLATAHKRPNIVFILADDLGFNDVGFHGSPQIPTPNIDEIAHTGVVLDRYYTQPICTASRSSILTGRHVIHTGAYHAFLHDENMRLNTSYTLLPQYLKQLGYATYMIGKWHLGHNELAALPTARGFDKYFGYWTGSITYNTHSWKNIYDLADGTRTAWEHNGTESTSLFTSRAVKIIEKADPKRPFFLYLAYQNIHYPLDAPPEYLNRFSRSTGGVRSRQLVCALTALLDEGVGNVTAALKQRGMYEDSLIIFSSDNGGPTNNYKGVWSSNYPLRGGKNSLWEGGTRAVAAVRGLGLQPHVSNKMMHATDWLRTLLTVASGNDTWFQANMAPNEAPYLLGDGLDVWPSLKAAEEVRGEVLLETHPPEQRPIFGKGLIVGDWKLVQHTEQSPRIQEIAVPPPPGQIADFVKYTVQCPTTKSSTAQALPMCHRSFCLFDLKNDPCERHDMSALSPQVLDNLVDRLQKFTETAVPMVTADDKRNGCKPLFERGAFRPCDAPDPDVDLFVRSPLR